MTAKRRPDVSEQPSERFNDSNIPDQRGREGSPSNKTDQPPEQDAELMTPLNDSDAMGINEDDPRDSKSLQPFRLLPQLSLWEEEGLFNDGNLLQCPKYPETLLRASPRHGSGCVLYYCCQCSMGPQVWQINPYCSNCHVRFCSRCKRWPANQRKGVMDVASNTGFPSSSQAMDGRMEPVGRGWLDGALQPVSCIQDRRTVD